MTLERQEVGSSPIILSIVFLLPRLRFDIKMLKYGYHSSRCIKLSFQARMKFMKTRELQTKTCREVFLPATILLLYTVHF